MNNDNNDQQASSPLIPQPLEAWRSGFDYAFGFQIDLMLTMFGLGNKKKD